ncbi:MAG: FAD:protein FMN transferase [Burkholderiales bacterium]|nr:MAG: FAD:protein FMN transferase [Betaproteobacteria bacterium]TAG24840.1 MAG: FAD:protein FMN transferase [Burkholderiales bacterium]
MACDCELLIVADNELGARAAAVAAIEEVRRIEHKYSRYRADSVVAEINANAGGASLVSIDEETAQLIAFADQLFAASGGLFDITSGVLRRAWNFKNAELPSNALIAEMVALIGWQRVERNARQLRLRESGMEIDFGGFGKEYAADRAASVLIERGVANALVNLGGDVRALGHRGDGAPWRLGIRHPRVDGETLASIPLVNTALATSGDYERFVDVGGVRYCHVLNPKTGWPVQHWQSISVVAPVCAAAGALATIAMLKGTEALPFLREQGVSFLAVDAQGALSSEATLP